MHRTKACKTVCLFVKLHLKLPIENMVCAICFAIFHAHEILVCALADLKALGSQYKLARAFTARTSLLTLAQSRLGTRSHFGIEKKRKKE